MKTICFISSLTLFIFTYTYFPETVAAQKTTIQTGLIGGNNKFSFSADDPADVLQPGEGYEWSIGIPIQITHNQWTLQTGFFTNSLTSAYYFNTESNQYGRNSYSSAMTTNKIPILIGRKINVTNIISFTPHIGISWLLDRKTGETGTGEGSYGYILESGEKVKVFEYSFTGYSQNSWKFLGEFGVDVNYSLSRYFILSAGVTWSYGLQNVETWEFTYYTEPDAPQSAVLRSNANSRNVHLGIRIPFYLN